MQANYFWVFHQTKVCIFAFIKNLNLKMICQDLLNLKMFLQNISLEFACCQTNFFGGHIRKQAWSYSENWAVKFELQKLSFENWATTIEFQNLIDKKWSFHQSTIAQMAEQAIRDRMVPGSILTGIQWDTLLSKGSIQLFIISNK